MTFIPPLPTLNEQRIQPIYADVPDQALCYGDYVDIDLNPYIVSGNGVWTGTNLPRGWIVASNRLRGTVRWRGEITINLNDQEVRLMSFDGSGNWTPQVARKQVEDIAILNEAGTWQEGCNGVVNFNFSFTRQFRRHYRIDFSDSEPMTINDDKFYILSDGYHDTIDSDAGRAIRVYNIPTGTSSMQQIDAEKIAISSEFTTQSEKISMAISGDYAYVLKGATTESKWSNSNPISTRTYTVRRWDKNTKALDSSYTLTVTLTNSAWTGTFVPTGIAVTSNRIYIIGDAFSGETIEAVGTKINILQSYTHAGVFQASELRTGIGPDATNLRDPYRGTNLDGIYPYPNGSNDIQLATTDTHMYVQGIARFPYNGVTNFLWEFPITNNIVSQTYSRVAIVDAPGILARTGLGRDSQGNFYYAHDESGVTEAGITKITNAEFNAIDPTLNFTSDWIEFDPPIGTEIRNVSGTISNETATDHSYNVGKVTNVGNKLRVTFNTTREYNETIQVSGGFGVVEY